METESTTLIAQMEKAKTDDYIIKFRKFVYQMSLELSQDNLKGLMYIYKEWAQLQDFSKECVICGIDLLEHLEKARVFHYDEPDKITDMLSESNREDLIEKVEAFVEEHKEVLSCMDRTYYNVPPGHTRRGDRIAQEVASGDVQTAEDGYVKFQPLRSPSPADEEEVYTYVEHESLRYVPMTNTPGYSILSHTNNGGVAMKSKRQDKSPDTAVNEYEESPVYESLEDVMLSTPAAPGSQVKKASIHSTSNQDLYAYPMPKMLECIPESRPPAHGALSSGSESSISADSPPASHRGLGMFIPIPSKRQDSSSDSDRSSDTAVNGYESPVYESLKDVMVSTPAVPRSLVRKKLNLLVKPVREKIRENREQIIAMDEMLASHHTISNMKLQLRIVTRSEGRATDGPNGYISADLFLISDAVFPKSTILKANIKVSIPNKYFEVNADDKRMMICTRRRENPRYITRQSMLLDLPPTRQDITQHNGEFVPVCVASFRLVSHSIFMNDNSVCSPFVCIGLTVKE